MSSKINISRDTLSTLSVDKMPFIRTAYDGLQNAVSDATALVCDLDKDPSLTQEQFAEECDINAIMERFALTGEITHVSKIEPRYGDWSLVPEYQQSLNLVIEAKAAFDALSAKIRDRFHNNPESFLKFVSNPDNAEEMYSLGILDRQKASSDGATPLAEPSNGPPEGAPAPDEPSM